MHDGDDECFDRRRRRQGTILASRVLSQLLIAREYDVKVSEIHGMSQRGGNVVTQVRFVQGLFADHCFGESDYIRPLKSWIRIRVLPYLKEGAA